ncbi:MAG: hypothetical protein A2Y15_02880 [Clostridiales bacterium GWF2_36_10]|nr:MAG: hypothetical protein A2Y15_02880 [Clostridiales bacterium GWF2_36_10]HAN20918.1 hypothetical protein [Clostridiales bacterium]
MTQSNIEKLISESIKSAPEELWKKIKYEIAKVIADELLEKLEKQKAPKKQESMDRTNDLIITITPKFYFKGVNNYGSL